MEKSAFKGYEEISTEELRAVKPYVDLYRRMEVGH
jgi:hypothetical protein